MMLAIIAVTVVLYSFDRISPDVIALGLVAVLVMTGLLPVEHAFSGFASDTFILILGLLVITAALEKTGTVSMVSDIILRHAGTSPRRFLVYIMVAAALLSTFMSNTGAAAFFLPIAIGLAGQVKISRSKLLMPMAFASILASSMTLISTTTNLVISGIMPDYGMEPLGMFELTPVGAVILLVGILYMATIGQKLIPDRPYEDILSVNDIIQNYLTELVIPEQSALIGKTLAESGLGHDQNVTVIRILKDTNRYMAPSPQVVLEEGDLLLVEADRDSLLQIQEKKGLVLKPGMEIMQEDYETVKVGLFEVILLPGSRLIGRTLKQLAFRQQFGMQVLGINRNGQVIRNKLSDVNLSIGDQLLVHGSATSVIALNRNNTFRLVQEIKPEQRDTRQSVITLVIFVGMLLTAGLNIIPLSLAAVLGMFLVFIFKSITPEEAYIAVNWRTLIMISGMLALGLAIQQTGTAQYLSELIISITKGYSPLVVLGGFFILSMLLSQPMSNQAAAVVVVPFAIQTALLLGLNPRSFAVMIALGASCSFLTPLEPACLMVYGPGNYRFMDFVKVGSLLTLAIFIIALVMVPILWPLGG
jgi:di/tricarboxylate transporter